MSILKGTNKIASIKVGGEDIDDYVRPSDWLTIPSMSGTSDEIYILVSVAENGVNVVGFNVNGTGTIDWGDGSATQSLTSTSTLYQHEYDYNDLSSSSYTEHNKSRQALIHITATRNTINTFNFVVSYSNLKVANPLGTQISVSSYYTQPVLEVNGNVQSCTIKFGSSSGSLFVDVMEIFKWDGYYNASNISDCFRNCYSLRKIYGDFDTSRVTDWQYFLYNCSSIVSVPQLDTSNATNMQSFFNGCRSLQIIPDLDTSKVTNMSSMFSSCQSLSTVPLFDTSKVTTMASMFSMCTSLNEVPNFDTSKVANMSTMFNGCTSLNKVPNFDTSTVTNMSNMFNGCTNLQYLPDFNIPNATNLQSFVTQCSKLRYVSLTNTSNVKNSNFNSIFNGCQRLKTIANIDVSNATSFVNLSPYLYSLENIPVLNCSNLTSSFYMDSECIKTLICYNFGYAIPNNNTTLSITNAQLMDAQALVDLFNSVAPYVQSGTYKHTLSIGTVKQGYLANVYVKDSGVLDSYVINGTTITATWNKYVICESTDTGAMLALDYARNIKGWTIT